MKRNKLFFRSFFISLVIIFCVIFGMAAVAEAYENIRHIAFGEYRKAIEIEDGKLYIFDYELEM